MSAEKWKVVLADGTVREVVVALYPRAEGPRWSVVDAVCGPLQRELTPREAVVVWCATHAYRSVVEIRGPGELTTAETLAVERSEVADMCEQIGRSLSLLSRSPQTGEPALACARLVRRRGADALRRGGGQRD